MTEQLCLIVFSVHNFPATIHHECFPPWLLLVTQSEGYGFLPARQQTDQLPHLVADGLKCFEA